MADEGIDAGLEELTSDVLGAPATDSQDENVAQAPTDAPQEPIETQQPQDASAPAPTAPQPPDAVEIDGRQYTREQLKAALTTREQFPHLQQRYLELKRAQEARDAQAQQPQSQADAMRRQIPPQQLQAQIRASFDPQVQQAVQDGFIEPDLAELYPNAVANLMMQRDSLVAVGGMVQAIQQKIAEYERQIVGERVVNDIKSNLTALASTHPALAPLRDAGVRDQFFGFIRTLDPRMDQLGDPEYLTGAWAAFKKGDFLGSAQALTQNADAAQAARATQRRRAVGDALPGSRPAAGPPQARSPLDEMVDDFFSR